MEERGMTVSWKARRLLALVPVAATFLLAQSAEAELRSVRIAGDAEVGLRLRAVARPAAGPAPLFQWLRCAPERPRSCEPIAQATGSSYVVDAGDVGHRLAVRARRRGARRVSDLTRVVPHPYALPVPPQYMQPFPVVRLKGRLSRGGADITLLRVSAPRGAAVRVRCTGPSCPLRRTTHRPGRIKSLERHLRAGTRITVRVTSSGFIGKYVRIAIRDGRAPARRDACLLPGSRRPRSCPSL
jgi:hypothetical protein